MRENMFEIAQPLDLAWSTIKSDAIEVVPAPMSEDVNGGEFPHDRAWTIRTNGIRVPAPMRENMFEIAQPLDLAWSTIKSDAIEVVPAPRLELGTP
jgi:hypothetical protein